MSAPMAVNDLVQITYKGTLLGQTILTVLHARVKTAPGGSSAEVELQDVANKAADRTAFPFLDKYLEAASNTMFMVDVTVQKVAPFRTIYTREPIGVIGDDASPTITPNLAVSIKKQSTFVGRRGVGRMQFAPIPQDKMQDGEIILTYKNGAMTVLANEMVGSFTGLIYPTGQFQWCLPAGGSNPAFDLYDAFPRFQLRTMHRRTLGLGI